jgi:geranylgeranyl pyrophosphate synthase
LAETVQRARAYARAARDSLATCPESEIRSALADIAGFVVDRVY